jgi:hypothetical protein
VFEEDKGTRSGSDEEDEYLRRPFAIADLFSLVVLSSVKLKNKE